MNDNFKNKVNDIFSDTHDSREIRKYINKVLKEEEGENDSYKIHVVRIFDNNHVAFKNKTKVTDPFKYFTNFRESLQVKFLAIANLFTYAKNGYMAVGDYNQKSSRINIYVDGILLVCKNNRPLNKSNYKSFIHHILYHEKRHQFQHNKILNNSFSKNFDDIVTQMELLIHGNIFSKSYYKKNHDDWFIEIDADRAAINDSLIYDSNHPEEFKKKEKKFIKWDYEYNYYRYANYNFDNIFNIFCKILKAKPFDYEKKYKKSFSIYDWYTCLFYDDKLDDPVHMKKSLEEKKIDPRFFNMVITSDYYINEIDYSVLTGEDFDILEEEFKKRIEFEKNKENIILRLKSETENKFNNNEEVNIYYKRLFIKNNDYLKDINYSRNKRDTLEKQLSLMNGIRYSSKKR